MSTRLDGHDERPFLERAIDFPAKALLWLPWPSTPRILFSGSVGFLKQILRSRGRGLRRGGLDRKR